MLTIVNKCKQMLPSIDKCQQVTTNVNKSYKYQQVLTNDNKCKLILLKMLLIDVSPFPIGVLTNWKDGGSLV